MPTPMLAFIRMVRAAAQGFAIKDDFEFIKFDDLTGDMAPDQAPPDFVEILASVKLHYEGEPPESYKVLNLMIGDYVETHLDRLTDVIHARLREHFERNYPGSDSTELNQLQDSAIWTDQLDYMPDIDEASKTMTVDIDLVLHGESLE